MSKHKHILLLTPGFPSDEDDDTCMPYLQAYLKEVINSSADLLFTVVSVQYPYRPGSYKWNGITVHSCGGQNRSFPIRLFHWLQVRKRISQIHAEQQIDVIHSLWLSECTFLAQRWAKKHNVGNVATAMGQDVLATNRYLKRLDFSVSTLVAVSSRQNNELFGATNKRAEFVIPWGTPVIHTEQVSKEIDVLGVGSLHALKNFDRFLNLISQAVGSKPNLRVVIIGDGPDRQKLEVKAEKLGVSGNVLFAGKLPHTKVIEMMNRSKVLLHTSRFESQGYVFAEAMACGMSIVSTQVGSAVSSERWYVCKTDAQMITGLLTGLQQQNQPQPLFSVAETIQQYIHAYSHSKK